MPLSTDEHLMLVVREWVPESVATEDDIDEFYDGMETPSLDATILHFLEKQMSELVEQPGTFTVPGLSISIGQNMTTLQAQINKFMGQGGTGLDDSGVPMGNSFVVRRLTRPDYR